MAKERFAIFDFDTTVKLQDHLPRRLDLPFSLFSILGSAEIIGTIWLTLILFLVFKKYFLAALSMVLLPFGLMVELFGKLYVHHPSPPVLLYRGVLQINFPSHYVHTDYSYPSGHMFRTSFIITFVILYVILKSRKKIWFTIPPLIAILAVMFISRIYLGEHWFSDVVGGLLLGVSLALFSSLAVPAKKTALNP